MADFLVLRGAADPLPIKYKDMGDGSAAEVISASVSVGGVTVDPFAPNGNVASLAVSQTTANVALPAGVTVLVTNTGANKVYLKLSVGAGSAAITDMALQAGAAIGLKVGSNTFINAIADTGLTSSLRIAGGAGLPTGFGGGGTSGGGGGDASAANQTVVQGVIGAATAPTKMNVGGGVYNSSPITLTNGQSAALQMDANGYLNVNVKSATGVAQGSTTSGQSISPVGGAVTTAAPTYTTGQTSPLSLDTTGALRVNVTAGGAGGGAVEGVAAHDASATGADPVLVGGYAKAAAPADVSADGDAVNGWFLRNGAQATVLTAAGALIGGDATNGLDVDITRMAALVAGSALIGNVGHGKTIKSVGFSLTADGDLVALVSSKRIKVIAYYFSKAGTTASIYNIRTNNAAGTILAKIQLQAQTGGIFAANLAIAAPSFLFASAAGEALYLDVPDAEAVTGFITYFDDDAT